MQDNEWDSVGTLVNVRHLKATPVGTQVNLKAKVIKVVDKRITFEVEATDRLEKIGDGLHERAIINVPEFRERFNNKIKKLANL